jgi:hypothetical protein
MLRRLCGRGCVILRVNQAQNRFGTVVNVYGQLVGDYVQVVEDCCLKALLNGKPVRVFLRDVSVIDTAGRDLLRRLSEQGVRLLGSGVYTSHLVKSLRDARGRKTRCL